jgi:hypothetical protein
MARIEAWIAAVLAAALLRLPLAAQEPRFSEQLTVREREIVVDVPDSLAADRLGPEDFLVLVDGAARAVTRTEPVGTDWSIVVYVDRTLASPGTVFYSSLALAKWIAELTRLGAVELVIAGSDPRVAVAATRSADPLRLALTDLAAEARVERDLGDVLAATREALSSLAIRRQLDKLLGLLTSRRPSGPHAVLFIVDGLEASSQGALAGGPDAEFPRAGRLLAAYGWTTLAVSLGRSGSGQAIAPRSEIEILREGTAPSSQSTSVPPLWYGRYRQPGTPSTLAFTGVIELWLDPRTAALRTLSQATAGTVIGFEEQLGPTLADLSRRRRIWIADPDLPPDGGLHPLEVRIVDRVHVDFLFTGLPGAAVSFPGPSKPARTQQWLGSASPEEIADVRLDNLLAGQPAAGDLPLVATAARTAKGLEIRLAIDPLSLTEPAPAGPVRISYAFPAGEGTAAAHHEILPAGDLVQGWHGALTVVPPAGSRRLAVVVEALNAGRWFGRALPIPD